MSKFILNEDEVPENTSDQLEDRAVPSEDVEMTPIGMLKDLEKNHGLDLEVGDANKLFKVLNNIALTNIDEKAYEEDSIKHGEYADIQTVNLLIFGLPGAGKTSVVYDWFRSLITMKPFSMKGSSLTKNMLTGIPVALKTERDGKEVHTYSNLPSNQLDPLFGGEKGEYVIYFIDEINRSYPDAEAAILEVINKHLIPDSSREGQKYAQKYLFTIATANPPSGTDAQRGLSMAMMDRFKVFYYNPPVEEATQYIIKSINSRNTSISRRIKNGEYSSEEKGLRDIEKNDRKLAILEAISNSEDVRFSNTAEVAYASIKQSKDGKVLPTFSPRSLMRAIISCNGEVGKMIGIFEDPKTQDERPMYTEGSFLDEFIQCCGYGDKIVNKEVVKKNYMLDIVVEALKNVKDDMSSKANGTLYTLQSRLNAYINGQTKF